MKKRAVKSSIGKVAKAKVADNSEEKKLKEEETPGFTEDMDFKKFLGCGG